MMEDMSRYSLRQFLQGVAAVCAIALFYAILEAAGITCPILYLTGISCAGCGMSRAWLSLLSGDPAAAAAYHPLFWVPPVVLLGWLLRRKLPGRLMEAAAGLIVIMFLVVYALRMADPEDIIVVFHPEEGLILRVLRALFAQMQNVIHPLINMEEENALSILRREAAGGRSFL